ncbi:rhomboid family intramembrane serine protease [Allosphingosinicella humi]
MRPPERWHSARATLVISGLTALAWLGAFLLGYEQIAAVWGGFIPARVAGLAGDELLAPVWLTPLTATFVHAGLIHVGFNLAILLFCGRAVENILGAGALLILYGVGAYAAAAGQYALGPNVLVPMVGASGAISSVLGAYAALFGRNRVRVANPTLAFWLNALWLIVAWIVLQAVVGITFETSGMRIAVGAHIGGFIAGLLLARPLLLLRYRRA